MSNPYQAQCDSKPCEFTIPIKINVPVQIYPQLQIMHGYYQSNPERLPIYLNPDVLLQPHVLSKQAECECLPEHNGYSAPKQIAAQQTS